MERFEFVAFVRQIETLPLAQQLAAVDAKRAECDRALGCVRGQLDAAKAKAATGEYSDPQWFRAASAARRAIGWNTQRLNEYRGRLRQQIGQQLREQRQGTFLEHFYEICKTTLPPELLHELVTRADAACLQAMAQAVALPPAATELPDESQQPLRGPQHVSA